MKTDSICEHVADAGDPTPRTPQGCEECLKTGDSWVHLRLCTTCGHVGCCDSSPNTHATKHFHATHHPVIRSFQPGESWRWCFVDELFVP
jgi:uncharacterized UBP type Zn finger protein